MQCVYHPGCILCSVNQIFEQVKDFRTQKISYQDLCVQGPVSIGCSHCEFVTRSDDAGCNSTTSQHSTIPLLIEYSLFLRFYKGIMSEKEMSQLVATGIIVCCKVVLSRPPSSDLVTDAQGHKPQGREHPMDTGHKTDHWPETYWWV